ncbi:hypothetical protein PFDG_03957 [Plasmodium falciparum Dd2]|uniref:WD repeat-containing protein n=1 Tax=Plasmodium falciparum (isolate Dd2) TaxID=57267 RepID=A0A0L7M828_PLAF4|nr:hypothetical protein PFDG_03957 [Plasmodium falciparum Dd2]
MDKFVEVEQKENMGININSFDELKYADNIRKSIDGYLENDLMNIDERKNVSEIKKDDFSFYEDKILNIDFSYDNNLLVTASCNNIIDFYNCSKASQEIKSTMDKKRIKLNNTKDKNRYVKLSKSFGVHYSNLISAKFTPENALLLFDLYRILDLWIYN